MPSSVRMDDGFATLITLANIPTVKIYEKEVTPPGWSGGDAIDTTTMRNTTWRTGAPRKLKSLTQVTAVVAFATEALSSIQAQLNVNQQITVTFPDNSTLQFYGYLAEFTPGRFTEGEQPTATITIRPTLVNNSGVETAPVFTPAS